MRSLFFSEFAGDRVLLEGVEGHHAANVLRVRIGEEIDVSDNRGGCAVVRIDEVGSGRVAGSVIERRVVEVRPPRIVVAQALIKGEAMTTAVDLMTQVGVTTIIPWEAERSIVRWSGEKALKGVERLRSAAMAAAKQSRNPLIPTVDEVHTAPELTERLASFGAVFLLHEEADLPMSGMQMAGHESVLMIVGPEGGLAPVEIASFSAAGAFTVRLGPTVLRSAHAGAIAAAALLAGTAWR